MVVYVVLSERGEYSNCSVWVSGVYTSEEMARAAMEEGLARGRVYKEWQQRFSSIAFPDGWIRIPDDERLALWQEACRQLDPTKPEGGIERATILAVELDTWVTE